MVKGGSRWTLSMVQVQVPPLLWLSLWRDGFCEHGCIHDRMCGGGLRRSLVLMAVIQNKPEGGLRRRNGEVGGGVVAFSWVVRGKLTDN